MLYITLQDFVLAKEIIVLRLLHPARFVAWGVDYPSVDALQRSAPLYPTILRGLAG